MVRASAEPLVVRGARCPTAPASLLIVSRPSSLVVAGFVSYATVEEADAAMNAMNGSWVAGREMKVEKSHS